MMTGISSVRSWVIVICSLIPRAYLNSYFLAKIRTNCEFYRTNLQELLTAMHVTHLIMAGVTTEVCVQTTIREANDRGYECLLVEDATASYFPAFKQATLDYDPGAGGDRRLDGHCG